MNQIETLRDIIKDILREDYRFQYGGKKFYPNHQMKSACKYAIDAATKQKLTGKGEAEGTGLKKAYSIMRGDEMSHGQVKRMKAFFDNNYNAYKAERARGKNAYNSGVIQKWNLWGGDAGYTWSSSILKSHQSKNQRSKDNRPKGHKNMMDPTNTRTKTAFSYVKNKLQESDELKKKFQPIIGKTVYHGTPDARFSQIKNSLAGQLSDDITTGSKGVAWFTDNYYTAQSYADPKRAYDYQEAEPKVLTRSITIENPLVVDAGGMVWRRAEFEFDGQKVVGTRALVDYAKENGYDGIMVKNVYDNYSHFRGEDKMKKYRANTYAVFSDSQISG